MAKYQGIEGVTLIDAKDKFEGHTSNTITGVAEALAQFGQQLSGALQIPLVRLFGQSPSGMNASGESDLRTYYDGVNSQQNRWLKEPLRDFYIIMGKSEGIPLPPDFDFRFASLWQLTDEQRATVATATTGAVTQAFEAGIITQPIALKELRGTSHTTGLFDNITDEDIEAAEADPIPSEELKALTAQKPGEAPPVAGEKPDTGIVPELSDAA